MEIAKRPENESGRLSALEELQLLDPTPEENYDDITRLASFICKVPVSFISLIGKDKQLFKSRIGTDIKEAPRNISHCSHAILNPAELMEVPDTRLDKRFKDNPYTFANPAILFYAGMPLKDHKGLPLGTLCVLDTKPNELTEDQRSALKSLAKQVENLFEIRRKNIELAKASELLTRKNLQLKEFAGTVSHDMKMPLANMIMTVDLIKAKYQQNFDEDGLDYLDYLKKSSFKLSNYITSILNHYESDTFSEIQNEEFDIHDLLEDIIDLLNINYNCEINLPEVNMVIKCNRIALEQIFLNLLGNSLKYNNKEEIVISLECNEDEDFYNFSITDNGVGIPEDKREDIFELFTVIEEADRTGNRGNGIGLSTVKKLVSSLGGNISVTSEVNVGTTFKFSLGRHCTDHVEN